MDTAQHVNELGLAHSAARLLPKDTVCLSRTASVGYVAMMGKPMATSQDFVTWSCGDLLNPRYLMNAILAEGDDIRRFGKGSTHTTIYFPEVKALHIALPPVSEQRRIVAKVDSLSAKSKRARDHLGHIPRLVEKYKQAILAAAFRGELTKAWRETNCERGAWTSVGAGEIIQRIVSGKNLRCEERPPARDERGVLKFSAVTWGKFDALAAKTLPVSFVPPQQTQVKAGDFLISRANTLELVGAVVVVAQTPPNLFLSDKILRLEMVEDYKPWMLWFLRSPDGRMAIEASATGNQLSMRNISQDAIRAIKIPWPSGRERREILRRIETAFTWIDRLASEATSARKLIDHLDQAILSKAFRGELVPQDPTDEPANVLLERIHAERSSGANSVGKRSRRTGLAR